MLDPQEELDKDDICGDGSGVNNTNIFTSFIAGALFTAATDPTTYNAIATEYNYATASYVAAADPAVKKSLGKKIFKLGCKAGLALTGFGDYYLYSECIDKELERYNRNLAYCASHTTPELVDLCIAANDLELAANLLSCVAIAAGEFVDPWFILISQDLFLVPGEDSWLRHILINNYYDVPYQFPVNNSGLPWCTDLSIETGTVG